MADPSLRSELEVLVLHRALAKEGEYSVAARNENGALVGVLAAKTTAVKLACC